MAKQTMLLIDHPPHTEVTVDDKDNTFTFVIDMSAYTKDISTVSVVLNSCNMLALLEFYFTNVKSPVVEALASKRSAEKVDAALASYKESNRPSLVRKSIDNDFT